MLFSRFAPMSLYALQASEPESRAIYHQLLRGIDGTTEGGKSYSTEEGTRMEAMAHAQALAIARARQRLRQAGEQVLPWKMVEGLPIAEADLEIIPPPDASVLDRRAEVGRRFELPAGASRAAIESALQELLGADFLALHVVDIGDAAINPANLG